MNFDLALDNLVDDLRITTGGVFTLVTNTDEIVQRVKIHLRWFLGEWFLDTSAGVPWMQQILGQKNVSNATMLIRAQIVGIDGVDSINSLNVRFDTSSRELSIYAVLSIGGQSIAITEGVPIG